MKRASFLISAFIFALAPLASFAGPRSDVCDQLPGDPAYQGLPLRLSADLVQDRQYVPVPPSQEAPPLVDILRAEDGDVSVSTALEGFENRFDGLDWFSDEAQAQVAQAFPQEEFVRLPKHQRIHVHSGTIQGRFSELGGGRFGNDRIWEYPIGTEIIHRVFADEPQGRQLLELRIIKRLRCGRWAMGAYVPTSKTSHILKLRTHVNQPVELDVGPRAVRASFVPAGAYSCRSCHFAHGDLSDQFGAGFGLRDREELVGPCEFGYKMDPKRLQAWEDEYRKRFGKSPILEDP